MELHQPTPFEPRAAATHFDVCTLQISLKSGRFDTTVDAAWQPLLARNLDALIRFHEFASSESLPPRFVTHIELEGLTFLIWVDRPAARSRIFSRNAFFELHAKDLVQNISDESRAHLEALAELDSGVSFVDIDFVRASRDLPDFKDPSFQDVYRQTLSWEAKIGEQIESYKSPFFETISNGLLNLTADYPLIRIHLLKFLAILPSLDHDTRGGEVKRILLESFRRLLKDDREQSHKLPLWLSTSVRIVSPLIALLPAKLLAVLVRASVRFAARRFIAGENIADADRSITELLTSGRTATLDQLGELVVSPSEADQYLSHVLELIRGLSRTIPTGSKNEAGILSAHVSIKVTALGAQIVPEDFEGSYAQIAPRLLQILRAAKQNRVFINVDAEHYHVRDLVFEIYRKVLLEHTDLRDFQDTGIVLQAYLRDAHTHLDAILELAKARGVRMPIRLVKGAYWDAETVEAEAHGFVAPQFLNKVETDIHYRQLVHRILEASDLVQLCVASHNLFDHAFSESLRDLRFPTAPVIEHQCLHMTYEALSIGLAKSNLVVRNYVPIGSLLVGMAYLVRRIMENSSQVGFLTQMRQNRTETTLTPSALLEKARTEGRLTAHPAIRLSREFKNVSPVRLFLPHQKSAFEQARTLFQSAQRTFTTPHLNRGDWVNILNPSSPEEIVGKIRFATHDETRDSIARLSIQQNNWTELSQAERSSVLLKAAKLMSCARLEWAHWIIAEAGKSVREALADVDEAIDFLTYYSTEALKLAPSPSIGVTAVIAPWNFPLAIPCGMTCASLVTGNPTILKPAEQTPLIAAHLTSLLHKAGVPERALVLLPGNGEDVGKVLTEHPKVRAVVFTGSKAVGQLISETVQCRVQNGASARAITEMGGKNAIIVTSSAELDETIAGCIYSAFGHSGQKCSALSRIIVDSSVADTFIQRFSAATQNVRMGSSDQYSTLLNPVITFEDQKRLRLAADRIRREVQDSGGRIWVDRVEENGIGYSVGPLVVEIPFHRALDRDSEAQKEHFGPFVHIIRYSSPENAIQLFNSTEYALTGGIFSQSQDDIDFFLAKLEAGNIYINRSCTGARVAIEPFGGFKHSGTGPKAGGPQYLPAFVAPSRYAPRNTRTVATAELVRDPNLETGIARLKELPIAEFLENLQAPDDFSIRETWTHFLNWSERCLPSLRARGRFNRMIPGQRSVQDLKLIRREGLYIASQKDSSFACWISLIASLILGARVRVLLDQNLPQAAWRSKIRRLKSIGFDIEEVDFGSGDPLCSRHFYILDVPAHEVERHLLQIYASNASNRHRFPWMPRIISEFDGEPIMDFEALYESFFLNRAIAINTMRHGAPLEVSTS